MESCGPFLASQQAPRPAADTGAQKVTHGAFPGLQLAEQLCGHLAYGGLQWDGRGYRYDYLVTICRMRVQAAGYIDEHGVPRTIDYYRESETAAKFAKVTGRPERRRLVPGFNGLPPPSVDKELAAGVPAALAGKSPSNWPSALRSILWAGAREADLVASWGVEMAEDAHRLDVRAPALVTYFASKEAVKAMRERASRDLGATAAASKDLFQRLIGGSDGQLWCKEHGRVDLPEWIQRLAAEFALVRKARRVRAVANETWSFFEDLGTRDPMLTLSADDNMKTERPKLEKVIEAVRLAGAEPFAFVNDGCPILEPVAGWAGVEDALQKIYGVQASLKMLPTAATARDFLAGRGCTVPDNIPKDMRCGCEHQHNVVAARLFLYPPPLAPKQRGTPAMDFARVAKPFVIFNNNRVTGKCEFFDQKAGIWHESGGEFLLAGEYCETILRRELAEFRLVWETRDGKHKLVPIPMESPFLLRDPDFLEKVKKGLRGMQTHYQHQLDKHPAGKHRIHFANNVTVDEAPGTPEAMRVRPGCPEDRNTRFSPWCYEPPPSATSVAIRDFWGEVHRVIAEGGDVDEELRDKAAELAATDQCFGDIWYAPFKNAGDPIHAMRQRAGAVFGTRTGKVDWLCCIGFCGSNGKGTQRSQDEALLGTYNGAEERGYTHKISPDYFEALASFDNYPH